MLILFDQQRHSRSTSFFPATSSKPLTNKGGAHFSTAIYFALPRKSGFDLLLTADKNLAYQQNLSERRIAIVALGENRWSLIEPELGRIAAIVNAALPGSYYLINIPSKPRLKT
jgi:hypothetical protein